MAKSDDKILKEARRRLEAAWEYDKDNRDEANKDARFLALDQWPDTVRQQRELEGRPCLTLDHLNQYKNQVVNDIRQAKIEIMAVGVDNQQDHKLAELMTGLMRDVQYQSGARHVYADAANSQVGMGIGHFRFITEYATDSVYNQELKIKPIPYGLSVYWDPASYERDRSDANWCFVLDFIPTEDYEEKYPKAKKVDVDAPTDWDGTTGIYWASKDGVLIAEYWKKVPAKKLLVAFQDGSSFDMTDATDEDYAKLPPVVGQREVDCHKIVQYIVSGSEVLEGPHDWAGVHIPIVPVLGEEVHLDRKCVRKSLIRAARDGQQLYNYWRSAAAELIALAPKSKWILTAKMIAQYKDAWDRSNADPRPYLLYEPDERVAGGAPSRIAPPEPPAALWHEAALVNDDLKAATGIYDASLGAKGNETSGVAIAKRQQEGDVSNFHYADNLNRSLIHAGKIMLDLIPKIYDTERQVRLMAPDETYTFQPINAVVGGELVNNLSQGRFDVRVDIGPSYTTQRIEAVNSMLDFAKSDPQAMPFMRDIFVRNMDWPGADQLADRLKRTVPVQVLSDKEKADLGPEAQQPQQDPQVAIEQAKLQLEQQKAQADMQLKQQQAQQEMQIEQARLAMEARRFEIETGAKAQEAYDKKQADQDARAMDLQKHADSMQMEREKHVSGLQMEREKHIVSVQADREKAAEDQKVEREKMQAPYDFERDKLSLPKREEVDKVIANLGESMKKVQEATQEAIAQNNQALAKTLEKFGSQISVALKNAHANNEKRDASDNANSAAHHQSSQALATSISAMSEKLDGLGDLGRAMVEASNSAKAAASAAEEAAKAPKHIEVNRGRGGQIESLDVTVNDS